MTDIYTTEASTTPDNAKAREAATKAQLDYYNANNGQGLEQSVIDSAYAKAYGTYKPKGTYGFEGSGLFDPSSALFGGSGAAAEQAYQDVGNSADTAASASRAANTNNAQRQAASNQYGLSALSKANDWLGNEADALSNVPTSGYGNALAIRGVAGPGTEGMGISGRNAAALGSFNPESEAASNALHQQTLENAAAMHSLALSGRGGGANASAQAQGAALGQSALAGEGLQQQQLAAQQYQSNQALRLQALQGQSALGASQLSSALGNAQLSQQQQQLAAQAQLAGYQTQYGADAAANQLRAQQATNAQDIAKYQNQVAGNLVDARQTLGQVNANYLGQAQDLRQQQLSTEDQLRVQGLVNAAQTKAGLQNSMLNIQTQQDIANQAANTAMMGSMLSTGAGAVGAYKNSKEKDQW